MLRTIVSSLLAILVLYVIISFVVNVFFPSAPKTTYSNTIISSQIEKISELATLKYPYRNAAKSDIPPVRIFNFLDIPFTDKRIIVTYTGVIKFGVDMSQAQINVINPEQEGESTTIQVQLPPSTILSHELDEKSWEYWDTTSYIFNPLKLEDGDALREEQKAAIEQQVAEDGLFQQADEQAIAQVKAMLQMMYPDTAIQVSIAQP